MRYLVLVLIVLAAATAGNWEWHGFSDGGDSPVHMSWWEGP